MTTPLQMRASDGEFGQCETTGQHGSEVVGSDPSDVSTYCMKTAPEVSHQESRNRGESMLHGIMPVYILSGGDMVILLADRRARRFGALFNSDSRVPRS